MRRTRAHGTGVNAPKQSARASVAIERLEIVNDAKPPKKRACRNTVPLTQSRRIRRPTPATPAGNVEKSLCTEISLGRRGRCGMSLWGIVADSPYEPDPFGGAAVSFFQRCRHRG